MKRLVIMILCMFLLTGCDNRTDSQEQKEDTFVCIQKADGFHDYYIVYQRDTKVMYAVSQGFYNCGTFTLLVNPDGTPMLYEADEEGENE